MRKYIGSLCIRVKQNKYPESNCPRELAEDVNGSKTYELKSRKNVVPLKIKLFETFNKLL